METQMHFSRNDFEGCDLIRQFMKLKARETIAGNNGMLCFHSPVSLDSFQDHAIVFHEELMAVAIDLAAALILYFSLFAAIFSNLILGKHNFFAETIYFLFLYSCTDTSQYLSQSNCCSEDLQSELLAVMVKIIAIFF